ncbi:serine protease easter [Eurytemora carolleeae]|uniref:serine protease easter n=1 Tax=Eurytemora carolleeae TaxID=1294199 RepID=UPI000C7708D7|nr:serine protease easter [Eurytemora carolleeae]|eukprot:XP_023341822.1 serine protease easter-like [Eurytemora affinis]
MLEYLSETPSSVGQLTNSVSSGSCVYQDYKEGECVPYPKCFPFIKLLQNLRKPLPPEVPVIMREVYLCGKDRSTGIPKICCPSDGIIDNNFLGSVESPKTGNETTTATTAATTTTTTTTTTLTRTTTTAKTIKQHLHSQTTSSQTTSSETTSSQTTSSETTSSQTTSSQTTSTQTTSSQTTSSETTSTTTKTTKKSSSLKEHPGLKLLSNLDTCGRSLVLQRIVGGKKASLGQYPWLANIGYSVSGSSKVEFKCGGTLIGRRHILTAAHCVASLPKDYLFTAVRVGEYDISNTIPDCDKYENFCAPLPQDYKPELVLIHPDYNKPYRFNNDIALIKMEKDIVESDFVSPICLPLPSVFNVDYEDRTPEVAGWGAIDMYARNFSDVLQYVSAPIFEFEACSALYSKQRVKLLESQICAGGRKGEDSCSGDSGSGLMMDVEINNRPYDPRWIQIGVVSFGPRRCATLGVPAVYTNVTSYIPWILDSALL